MIEYRVGDVFDRLAEIPDGTIDLVLTSPPFLALRSYLPADHPHKDREIGSEPDPATFVDTLLRLTVEWRRILAPHGSICVELGDTYSGSGGSGGDYNAGGFRDGQASWSGSAARNAKDLGHATKDRWASSDKRPGWPLAKSICGVPWLYALSLAYGRNVLNHEHTIDPWRVRNVIAWCRPNPSIGALGDKFRPATSYMTIGCVGRQRYFDLDAVRIINDPDTSGAPPLDYREISTQPYNGSHYATWPEALVERPINAMCPQRVCLECGKPSERITEATYDPHGTKNPDKKRLREADELTNPSAQGMAHGRATKLITTVGWTDCGHNAWRTGIVLDPFGGSGTTLAVAQGLGRSAIGIDLDDRNADLARDRVGMFLEVV